MSISSVNNVQYGKAGLLKYKEQINLSIRKTIFETIRKTEYSILSEFKRPRYRHPRIEVSLIQDVFSVRRSW